MSAFDEDELEYLQSGFDPASLTVARLRGILVQYDIPYAASAKKPDLVATFNEQLVPRARKILSARARTTRTSRGITDMPSSQESTVNGDSDEEGGRAPPVAETPRRRTVRNSRQSTADTTESTPAPRKTPSRKKSSTQSRTSNRETLTELEEAQTATPRSRTSIQPVIKVEESDSSSRRPPSRGSVFSDDNPFQSGSSPVDGSERRRSSAMHGEKRKSTSHRRQTEDSRAVKAEDGALATSSHSMKNPTPRARKSGVKVEPGEEFTPEEQEELDAEEEASGPVAIRHSRRGRTGATGSALWALLIAILVGYGFLWRKEKLELGYCGVGKHYNAMQEYDLPEWLSFLQPACEPCPQHATCYAGMRLQCDADFVLRVHPFSLGGAVPLPSTCEPDSEKVRKVHAVAEKAVEELRERRAKFECGELTDEQGKPATAIEIEETQLKAEVSHKRRRGMSEAEFEELWKGALGEILGRDEITSDSSGLTGNIRLRSDSLARLPLRCALRRSARLTLARYRVEVAGIVALLVLLISIRNYVRMQRQDTARVPVLVSMALDRLATQAGLHSQGSRPEPWISSGRLRDDVLRDEFSAKRREDIWRRVQAVVEVNTNVRSSVREDRNGEVSRVWEWIGSLPAPEDMDRRQSGRLSLLPNSSDTPERQTGPVPAEGRAGTPVERRTWDEGHPIY